MHYLNQIVPLRSLTATNSVPLSFRVPTCVNLVNTNTILNYNIHRSSRCKFDSLRSRFLCYSADKFTSEILFDCIFHTPCFFFVCFFFSLSEPSCAILLFCFYLLCCLSQKVLLKCLKMSPFDVQKSLSKKRAFEVLWRS